MRFHICVEKKFSEKQIKFFAACLILGLKQIHKKSFIHRDIKPENIIVDDKGYLRITDFGISQPLEKHNENNTSGTPGYMAPEILFHDKHSFEVDYYALGVILYELVEGKRPIQGLSR